MNGSISKQEARSYAIKFWQSLPNQRRTELITKALALVDNLVKQNPLIRIFLTTTYEFELDILNAVQSHFVCDLYLPIIKNNRQMDFVGYRINGSLERLQLGRFGILEPSENKNKIQVAQEGDLMLIPCLAVNQNRFRLGRGGGFFDMYFYDNVDARNCKKVGILPVELVEINFSEDYHDIKLDELVTDKY
ncbi:MAG: 5-formyltetrahydrofolate cyclo-ligase [Leptonema sp. (in: Bacteria)]|nr:5-formyltetrahydrofolate cyclo-ligase [Leptonema sp. (in: bacteria)]